MKIVDTNNQIPAHSTRSDKFMQQWDASRDKTKYDIYQQQVKSILNQPIQHSNFKSLPEFRRVVLASASVGENRIIAENESRFTDVMSKERWYTLCKKADSIGQPVMENTPIGFTESANVKYMYHAIEILDQIKKRHAENPFQEINIVEIGGGYGGLAFFIRHIARQPAYNLKINKYTIFDLGVIMDLQAKVSDYFMLDISRGDLSNVDNILTHGSFLVSNYAYSELSLENKQMYMDKVFPYISHGLLSWNLVPIDTKYFSGLSVDTITVPYTEPFGMLDLRVVF